MNKPAEDPHKSVEIARRYLVQEGEVPSGVLRSEIEDSWQRSVRAGLDCEAPLDPENLSRDSVADLKEKNRSLIEAAHPELKQLEQYFSAEGGLVLLADADASLLGARGNTRPLDSATR